jgi:dCTP deaminase
VIVSNNELRRLMADPDVPQEDRIVVTPILDWDSQVGLGGCSIDVRLGQQFRVPRRTKLGSLDHLHVDHAANIERYKDEYHVLIGDYFVLHPRQFVLGETLEWVRLPEGYAAYVIGRSSWGRDGLVIATATGVHPGYSGILTLEITNLGEIPVRLYPGLSIAQLFIHQVFGGGVSIPHFTGSSAPESADAARDDKTTIVHLGRSRGFKHFEPPGYSRS